ncbi:MAG: efflux RND transporter periplasmic adaptor subunit [Deltaproteobacteria bacterium]|nr:efflux RND transporter periplasmic adaptor subunit [Deltaproteobacteria bacterium]
MKKTMKRPCFWIILVLMIVLALASLHRLEQLEVGRNLPEQAPAPLGVHAAPAVHGSISKWVCGEGTVTAIRKRHLIFQAAGKVVFLGLGADSLPLHEGSRVKGPEKGKATCLARLDSREAEEEIRSIRAQQDEAKQTLEMARMVLEQARKNLAHVKKRYDRSKKLFDRKAGTITGLEENKAALENALAEVKTAGARIEAAKAGVKGLRAKHEQALIHLENRAIYAPFDGVIARLNISQGDYFDPAAVNHGDHATLLATAPITIIDPGELEVILNIPVFDGMEVEPGQTSFIQWGSMDWNRENVVGDMSEGEEKENDYTLEARVYSVSPVLSISGRTVRIKVRARQDTPVLPHGMFVTCWIEAKRKTDVLIIPTACLLFRDGETHVYVENKGVAQKKRVLLGLTDKDKVEALEGISLGDRVITKGRHRLFPDRPVRIIEQEGVENHGA